MINNFKSDLIRSQKKPIFLVGYFFIIIFFYTYIYLFIFFFNMPYPGLLGHRAMPYRGIYRRGATHTYGIPEPTQATGL